MTPVEDFLRRLTAAEGIRLEVAGEGRALPAEAGLAVRRVAQEALTNVRKHAPGARVNVRLEYGRDGVGLEVRDFGGRGSPASSGTAAPDTVCSGCGSAPNFSVERWIPAPTRGVSWCGCGCGCGCRYDGTHSDTGGGRR
ncbi:hypothetical protein SAMN05216511_1746 [Streptomyces sp. KS_16]|nr:hypothetical protein BX261_5516 [Streptomyces sp. 2321.6]SDR13460.1 hypothetical protein SAMN05216511_1746 [Streptomyces sp. KS_16]SED70065.1 hypothetical protein SAMN05428940_5542 [Streptomyces sp. 2133.1]SNC71943.1 hypothetical protein SAMN06272741_5443 [Streptomyces sp. 2114.4]